MQNPVRNQPPIWFPESPDLSDCKSAWLMSLQVIMIGTYLKRMTLSWWVVKGPGPEKSKWVLLFRHELTRETGSGKWRAIWLK